jgi:phosphoribosylformylglycinamidine synthase II
MSNKLTQHHLEKLKVYRISEFEYEKIEQLLGRSPNAIEWALFSALWSEHCSYKSSKIHLSKFSFRNSNTPLFEGENAGILDLGMGEKIAFKMESHNHPSFIEPIQGAATGVGGILRDIFTMGARPIMSANFLCFGDIEAPRMKYLLNGVVKGISLYGNCVGVPMLTGQTVFLPDYNQNILVNALSVGYFNSEMKMALSKAHGPGNLVVYVGAKTGRDGVHGASMASESFDDDSEAKKPNVQIGDPFFEKLLIEACLECLKLDLIVAMQDMGAAGLTSSSFEMASKGNIGLDIDLKKVPLRDQTMNPEEILLSESQERMLLICKSENLNKINEIFNQWSLDTSVLGIVVPERKIILRWGPEILTEIDPNLLVENAPMYQRDFKPWSPQNEKIKLDPQPVDAKKMFNFLIQKNKLNSFSWLYSQYDQRVGCRTASDCSSAIGIARLDNSGRGLALALGCRPEIMKMDARIGALDAVYFPSLQMSLKGFEVLAITDCLNFGNPQKNEIMTEFVASVEAIAEASKELNAPVISGNVSFYNETNQKNIISTPATGLLGIRDSVEELIPDKFSSPNENIFEIYFPWVESDLTVKRSQNLEPHFVENKNTKLKLFLDQCRKLDELNLNKKIKISSLKACSLGGTLTSLFKMCTKNVGFDISYYSSGASTWDLYKDKFYSFICVSGSNEELVLKELNKVFRISNVKISKIGETISHKIIVNHEFQLDLLSFDKEYRSSPFEKKELS